MVASMTVLKPFPDHLDCKEWLNLLCNIAPPPHRCCIIDPPFPQVNLQAPTVDYCVVVRQNLQLSNVRYRYTAFSSFSIQKMLTHLIYRRITEVHSIVLNKRIKASIDVKFQENKQLTIDRLLSFIDLIQ